MPNKVTLRSETTVPLTHAEMDLNFKTLKDAVNISNNSLNITLGVTDSEDDKHNIAVNCDYNIIVGMRNSLEDGCTANIVGGSDNVVSHSNNTFVHGGENYVRRTSNSIVKGQSNVSYQNSGSIIAGSDNVVNSVYLTTIFGDDNYVSSTNSTQVYGDDFFIDRDNALFIGDSAISIKQNYSDHPIAVLATSGSSLERGVVPFENNKVIFYLNTKKTNGDGSTTIVNYKSNHYLEMIFNLRDDSELHSMFKVVYFIEYTHTQALTFIPISEEIIHSNFSTAPTISINAFEVAYSQINSYNKDTNMLDPVNRIYAYPIKLAINITNGTTVTGSVTYNLNSHITAFPEAT